MKKNLLLALIILLTAGITRGQSVAITANAGSTQLNGLGYLNYHVSEYIYLASEIGTANFTTAGTSIKRINLNALVAGTPNFFNNVKIYLKNVPAATTTLAAGTYSTAGYTLVYSGTFTAPFTGWVGVALSTPFIRIASNNLQMMIERTDNVDHSSPAAIFTWATANGNSNSATATTSRRYNGAAAITATTALTVSAFRIAAEFQNNLSIDATLAGLSSPTTSCNATGSFSVILRNIGLTTIAPGTAAVTFRNASPNAANYTSSNTTSVVPNATETIIFNNVPTGNSGVTLDSAFVTLAGDLDRSNDTLKSAFLTTTTINVSSGAPAVEDVETTLPVFAYADIVVGDQLWGIWETPPQYINADFSDSLAAHSGNSFFYFDSYSGANSTGIVSRLFSNCLTLPAVSGGCTANVSFWLTHDNSFSTFLDSVYLTVSVDKGLTWTRIAGYGRYLATAAVPTWLQETVNLAAYQGLTFQLGFEGVSAYGNIIGLDDITVSTNCTLPVTLATFYGEKRGSINTLRWTTATENNNTGFELQRSPDGVHFGALTFVATKAPNGNSTVPGNYTFDDTKPLPGNSYYRLKQIDKDGKGSLSNIVVIKGIKPNGLGIGLAYPNPVEGMLNLVVTNSQQQILTLRLADMTGKTVHMKTKQAIAGDNIIQVNTAGISAGMYMLQITGANGETVVQKIVKK